MSHKDLKQRRAYLRKWRRENPDFMSAQRKKPHIRFSGAKCTAKGKGHAWHISYKLYENLITHPCFYCQRSLIDETGIGLDRINNDKGYYPNNVVQCCGICNRMRSDIFSVKEMLLIGKILHKIWQKRPRVESAKQQEERTYLIKIKKRKLERQQSVLNHMTEILTFCRKHKVRPRDAGDSKMSRTYESRLAVLLWTYLNRKSWYRTINKFKVP
jgi:hypothetical protein